MPCSGGPTDEERLLSERVKYLEACLCAIINEIEPQIPEMEIEDFLGIAGKNGKVDVINFWITHRTKDEKRIETMLNEMSEHERDIVRKIIKQL